MLVTRADTKTALDACWLHRGNDLGFVWNRKWTTFAGNNMENMADVVKIFTKKMEESLQNTETQQWCWKSCRKCSSWSRL